MEDYCRRRWGGSGWTQRLRTTGQPDGATFGGWQWWPNTLRGHQFIQYGRDRHGADTSRMNAVLFDAMYERGANLALVDTLAALAAQEFPDWNQQDLSDYLRDNRGAEQVQEEIAQGRQRYRITGVPYFVIGAEPSSQPPYAFSGAQPAETFREILEELADD